MTRKYSGDNIFFTADTHYFHRAPVEAKWRPFLSVEEMNEQLIKRHNKVVPHDALVFHLGDLSFAGTALTLSIIGQLHGRIVFIKGNHDSSLSGRVLNQFHEVHNGFHEVDIDGIRVVMCHYSLRTWNMHHYGSIHLHGHSHGSLPSLGRSMDVGVDCHDYAPICWSEVRKELMGRETHSNDHHRSKHGNQKGRY